MQKTGDNIFVLVLICIGGVFTLVISFVVIFIRNQNKLLREQRKLQQAQMGHQHELLQTVILSQDDERKRIGQDLHDDVGTALSNLRITIEMFDQSTGADLDSFQGSCKNIIDKVIQNVKHISHNLSPPGLEFYGFTGAVEELCESVVLMHLLPVSLVNNWGNMAEKLNKAQAMGLYRVMEELLNNTIKHAQASKVDVAFDVEDDHMLINYHDNGRGISPTVKLGKGMGMQNIESRLGVIGAVFSLDTAEGKGFTIQIKLKL